MIFPREGGCSEEDSIDDAIKRTIPLVDAEQAVSFLIEDDVHAGIRYSMFFVELESSLATFPYKVCELSS
jgi:hypothetical protein